VFVYWYLFLKRRSRRRINYTRARAGERASKRVSETNFYNPAHGTQKLLPPLLIVAHLAGWIDPRPRRGRRRPPLICIFHAIRCPRVPLSTANPNQSPHMCASLASDNFHTHRYSITALTQKLFTRGFYSKFQN